MRAMTFYTSLKNKIRTNKNTIIRTNISLISMLVMTSCVNLNHSSTATPKVDEVRHLTKPNNLSGDTNIPPIVALPPLPPKPSNANRQETYSVTVSNIDINDLLFALARDAKINLDVHPGLTGMITLNAINQTLPQILTRISKQIDMRFEFQNNNLSVLPDTPYLQNYQIDYVNLSREAKGTVAIATQVSATGGNPNGVGSSSRAATDNAGNNSTTSITTTGTNLFWTHLVENVRELLRETDKILPEGSSETTTEQQSTQSTTGTGAPTASISRAPVTSLAGSPNAASLKEGMVTTTRRVTFREAASVIANPETGQLSVRATSRQHEKIQEFLDRVMASAKRQVLIEATVVEVTLSEEYQQGINWQKLSNTGAGFSYTQQPTGSNVFNSGLQPGTGPSNLVFTPSTTNLAGSAATTGLPATALGVLSFSRQSPGSTIVGALALLESFGRVRVLSSPRMSVLNNQSAILKVVDNRVYFTIGVNVTPGQSGSAPIVTYTSTPNTVPVGFVMSVTPQIEQSGMVSMNIRPTISRIIGYVNDPTPILAQQGVVSRIPEIQTREMESLLRVSSGDIAVLGGLMQDTVSNQIDGIPGAQELPFLGGLFRYRNDRSSKSELVILIRPHVIKDASIEGDYQQYKSLVPSSDFFTKKEEIGSREGIPPALSISGGRP